MATVLTNFVNQQEIEDVVKEIPRLLAPDVIYMRYSLRNDSSGDPAIFFRVVLSDDACRPGMLLTSTRKVKAAVLDRLEPYRRWGRYPYFNFRSASEQAEDEDPAWRPTQVVSR